jgi:hypothetical protein
MLQGKASEGEGGEKIPTLEGMRQAIKTTIDANMNEALERLPYQGEPAWDSILPTESDFHHTTGKAPTSNDPAKDVSSAQETMLTQRQISIAHKEKLLAEEKEMLKQQMLNVAAAANHLENKFQQQVPILSIHLIFSHSVS